ncbi:uncharacterized membrane-anchored protein YhcB (DUF1043 family) [Paenibacillus sp. V4I7]|nr:uncharacterized membrane-anchored protein YhcB (DUF1043 family) [Paenibacillus sp. V4I7]MDQ0918425.1 uncharacterized membrane-anchored protein YhcB (DUF1043 family) [Paenibacillus sp. V4I5]
MYWLFLIIILICVLIFLFMFARKARDKLETRKVVQLSLKQKKNSVNKQNKQTCSFCRKKAKRLYFYSSESGQVLGVCDPCKPQAERRALMRI